MFYAYLKKIKTEFGNDQISSSLEKAGMFIQPIVQGTNVHVEFRIPFDPTDKETAMELRDAVVNNYHIWLRKIKEAVDPNNVADSGFYIDSHVKEKEG